MDDTGHFIRTKDGDIDALEIERAIAGVDGIAQVVVIGIPHMKLGEAVHAIVVPYAGATITAQDVIAACHSRVASNKCPRSVTIRSAPLPRSPSGEILRSVLKSEYW